MSGYPYPNDEFDTELDDTHALGIHHAPRSTWSKVWPFLVVIVVCAALAAALVTWFTLQGRPGSTGTPPPATTAAPSVTPTESDEPTPADPTTTVEASDEPTTEEPTTEEPTTEEPTTPELDRSTAIRVLNATRTQGLAATRVSTLRGAGWTNVVGDNFPAGSNAPATSSVWYRSVDLEDEAKQIAKDLGLANVTLVESLRGDVSVILVG
ncbi:LytR C-terminal domain-containing protein [Sanguibacter massiliensis]|uniref:LytR C-terminal domain-containing protein n=1 Tax=Sanguibacter massiliensis TaxID=1973217 RepID=UPI000C853451|nr:LytR C-terminal domain-containing protein [Sanguibacter massiliensis]